MTTTTIPAVVLGSAGVTFPFWDHVLNPVLDILVAVFGLVLLIVTILAKYREWRNARVKGELLSRQLDEGDG